MASIQRPSPPRLCCAPTLPCRDHCGDAAVVVDTVVVVGDIEVFGIAWRIIVGICCI